MNSADVKENERQAAKDGAETILKIIGFEKEILINDSGYLNQGSGEHESIDWYLGKARMATNNGYGMQFNADKILELYEELSLNKTNPHYIIMIIDKDLGSTGLGYVIGNGRQYIGAVLSVLRFRHLSDSKRCECLKTLVMHELGHVFGAAVGKNGIDAIPGKPIILSLYQNHCDQECVMRQGSKVPEAWIQLSEDSLKSDKPFCYECIDQMKKYLNNH